jgi:hypothetical protein
VVTGWLMIWTGSSIWQKSLAPSTPKRLKQIPYYAPHLNDEQIKAKYNDLILDKYSNANKELQTLLGQQ